MCPTEGRTASLGDVRDAEATTTDTKTVEGDSGPAAEDVPSVEIDVVRELSRNALFGERQASRKVGRFTLLEPVGRGGMGTVYAAYDPQLDRKIAIKLLTISGTVDDPSTPRRRMLVEARAMAKVSHPNVITVYEVGVVDNEDGEEPSIFVAMEFVNGKTLRQWVSDDKPTWSEIVEVYAAAGRGLQAVHSAGLVHRDFKPDNAMRDTDGRVRVMDFGLARDEGIDVPAGTVPSAAATMIGQLTKTGALLGTPAYMAPEQFEGGVADTAADQYTFCVSLYEALWGRRPHAAKTPMELINKVLDDDGAPAPPRAGVPGRIRRAVLRGLLRDPTQRWPSMDALIDQLRPRSGARRVTAALVGLGVVGAVVWVGGSEAGAAVCQGGAEAFSETWSDARRALTVEGLTKTGSEFSTAVADNVVTRLDAYAERWISEHGDACAATRVRGEQSESRLDQRMQCLRRRRVQFGALVDALGDGTPAAVKTADHAVDGLTAPERCADPAFLDAVTEPPADVAVAAHVERLRDQIDRTNALHATGASKEALASLERLSLEAQQIAYPPIQAEAEAAAAAVAVAVSEDFRPQLTRLAEAYFAARDHKLPLVAAGAALDISAMRATADSDTKLALHWLRLAQAEVRANGLNDLDAALGSTQATIAQSEGRYADAIAINLDLARDEVARCGDRCTSLADIYESLASLYGHVSDHDKALEYAEAALGYEQSRHGEHHPHLAVPMLRLGEAQASLGRYDEAVVTLQAAAEIRERDLGPTHANVLGLRGVLGSALVHANRVSEGLAVLQKTATQLRDAGVVELSANVYNRLAGAYIEQERFAESRTAYKEAMTLMEGLHPGPHPVHGILLSNIAHTYAAEGDHEAALVGFLESLNVHERVGNEPGPSTAPFLLNIGKELSKLGREGEAVAYLARASTLLAKQTLTPRIVELELTLATAQAAQDREAARDTVDALVLRCASQTAEQRKAANCATIPPFREKYDL